jgi:hypothetical protein
MQALLKPSDLVPLKAPRLTELPELQDKGYRDRMLWGSYRSGLYFGMRTRRVPWGMCALYSLAVTPSRVTVRMRMRVAGRGPGSCVAHTSCTVTSAFI